MHLTQYSKQFIMSVVLLSSTAILWAQPKSVTLIKDFAPQYFQVLQSESSQGVYINVREISYKANAGNKNSLLDTVSQMRVFDTKYLNESIAASIKSGAVSNGFGQGTYTVNRQKSVMTSTTTFPYIKSIDFNSNTSDTFLKTLNMVQNKINLDIIPIFKCPI